MANYLHHRELLAADDVVELTLDKACNVRFLTDSEFAKYKRGELAFKTHQRPKKKVTRLRPPSAGHWNIVLDTIDLQGATIEHKIRIIRA